MFHTHFLNDATHTYASMPSGWLFLNRPVGVSADVGIKPGQQVSFTVSGEGQMPAQPAGGDRPSMGAMGGGGEAGNGPGGGIGAPIGTPDPLTKYKWWILSVLTVLLVAAAAFMLRKKVETLPALGADAHVTVPEAPRPADQPGSVAATTGAALRAASPPAGHSALLTILKDELFAIESERLSGTLSEAEYLPIKAGLEAVLKRALARGR